MEDKIKFVQRNADGKVIAYAEWDDTEENRKYAENLTDGMFEITEDTYVLGYDGKFYLQGNEPEKPVEMRIDEIRSQRRERMTNEADELKHDYDEAVARGDDNAAELKELWLAKKDQIRKELPYPSMELDREDDEGLKALLEAE